MNYKKNLLDAVQHGVKRLKVITGAATRGGRFGVRACKTSVAGPVWTVVWRRGGGGEGKIN